MESFYAFALTFASEHVFLTWCALWLLWVPYLLAMLTLTALNSVLRTIKVILRGWPPEHLDADGYWKPEPKVEEKTETATVGDMGHTVTTRTHTPHVSGIESKRTGSPL